MRAVSWGLGVCLVFVSIVVANAGAKKAADESLTKYRRALRSGRKLEGKGDWAGAAAAFAQALAAKPNDGVAQSELGWVAFQQKDLDRAEQLIAKAIGALDEPHQLGAAYYNLGRVHEARNNKDAAVSAYKTSLEKRPNHVVRDRLAKLDPAAAAAADPAATRFLDGPFKTQEEACKTLAESGAQETCDSFQTIDKPAAPWKAVKLVKHGEQEELALMVQTAAGWFVSKDLAACSYEQLMQSCRVGAFAVENILAGPEPDVRLDFGEASEYRDDVEGDDGEALHPLVVDEQRYLMACGVGASGKPSCTGLLTVGVKSHGGGELPKMEFSFEAVFGGEQIELKPKLGKAVGDYRDALGVHKVVFP